MDELNEFLKAIAPEHSLDEEMNIAIEKFIETGEHHSVYQLSSDINPYMVVKLSSSSEELELYGLYEIWSTKTLNKTTTEEL
jgi:hypothetical protein